MKRLIVLLLLFISFCLPVSAAYYQIPADKSAQYRAEIEAVIKKQVPITKQRINNIIVDYKNEPSEFKKDMYRSIGIDSEILEFYIVLINVTNKYVPIKKDMPGTNYYLILDDMLEPYFRDNKVSTKEIDKLIKYGYKKQLIMGVYP